MTFLTSKELREVLADMAACQFVSITFTSKPSNIKSPKTSGMIREDGSCRLMRRTTINPICGKSIDYLSIVNRRKDKQGEERIKEVQPRKWGVRIDNSPFVFHKGNYYLETLCTGKAKTQYYLDGCPIDKDDAQQYLRPRKEADTYNLGDDKPIWRDIKLTNINSVTMDGQAYHVAEVAHA